MALREGALRRSGLLLILCMALLSCASSGVRRSPGDSISITKRCWSRVYVSPCWSYDLSVSADGHIMGRSQLALSDQRLTSNYRVPPEEVAEFRRLLEPLRATSSPPRAMQLCEHKDAWDYQLGVHKDPDFVLRWSGPDGQSLLVVCDADTHIYQAVHRALLSVRLNAVGSRIDAFHD